MKVPGGVHEARGIFTLRDLDDSVYSLRSMLPPHLAPLVVDWQATRDQDIDSAAIDVWLRVVVRRSWAVAPVRASLLRYAQRLMGEVPVGVRLRLDLFVRETGPLGEAREAEWRLSPQQPIEWRGC